MSLRDVNIGVRLTLGFSVVLTIMVVIAASGFYGMRGMNKSMTQIHIENDAKVRYANLAYKNLSNLIWAMRLVPYASGTDRLQAIQKQISEITMQVSQIATAAEEQTAATQENAGNIQQTTDVVQDTAHGAEETSSAAHELARQSITMQSLASQFKLT